MAAPPLPEWMARRLHAFGVVGAALAWVLTVLGFFGAAWWGFEMVAPFRLQYGLGALLAALLTASRPGRATWAAAGAALVNLGCVAPLVGGGHASAEAPLVVMSFNVHTTNGAREAVRAEVLRHRPHVFFALEANAPWLAALESLEGYRVVEARPSPDNFGIVALSRVEGARARVRRFGPAGLPAIEVVVPWRGRELALLGTHALPPIDRFTTANRDAHLMEVAAWARTSTRTHAVFGDLNITPYSPVFSDLEARGGLRRAGGLAPTWPARPAWMSWLLGIPIDHALLGPGLRAVAYEVGEPAGSDHRPIIVSLALAAPP